MNAKAHVHSFLAESELPGTADTPAAMTVTYRQFKFPDFTDAGHEDLTPWHAYQHRSVILVDGRCDLRIEHLLIGLSYGLPNIASRLIALTERDRRVTVWLNRIYEFELGKVRAATRDVRMMAVSHLELVELDLTQPSVKSRRTQVTRDVITSGPLTPVDKHIAAIDKMWPLGWNSRLAPAAKYAREQKALGDALMAEVDVRVGGVL
jgi:hypothetical protein